MNKKENLTVENSFVDGRMDTEQQSKGELNKNGRIFLLNLRYVN